MPTTCISAYYARGTSVSFPNSLSKQSHRWERAEQKCVWLGGEKTVSRVRVAKNNQWCVPLQLSKMWFRQKVCCLEACLRNNMEPFLKDRLACPPGEAQCKNAQPDVNGCFWRTVTRVKYQSCEGLGRWEGTEGGATTSRVYVFHLFLWPHGGCPPPTMV